MFHLTPVLRLAFLIACSFIPKIKLFQMMFTLSGMTSLFSSGICSWWTVDMLFYIKENIKLAKLGSVPPEQQFSHHSALADPKKQG